MDTVTRTTTDHVTTKLFGDDDARTETMVAVKRPNIVSRALKSAKTTLESNPIKTAVGASLAIGAAVLGGANYNRYGSPLGPVSNEDVRDIAVAGARLIASLR